MTDAVPATRVYTFDAVNTQVTWVDTWYNRFEDTVMTATSQTRLIADAFGLAPFDIFETVTDPKTELATQVKHTINPFKHDGHFEGVEAVGSGLMMQASYTVPGSTKTNSSGGPFNVHPLPDGHASATVDVTRLFASSVAEDLDDIGAFKDRLTALVERDVRRPLTTGPTRALTDDELFRVNDIAASPGSPPHFGVTGPQLFAILVVLTGARPDAYHPDGFYGISNLTERQLKAAGSNPKDFMAASMHRQLLITAAYLNTVTPKINGVIPLFLTLANDGALLLSQLPPQLPARLRPFANDGKTITAADITALVNKWTDLVSSDFAFRKSVNVSSNPPL
jgi:hypothetical protein